eukprot:6371833-Amphidinium_carterae.1
MRSKSFRQDSLFHSPECTKSSERSGYQAAYSLPEADRGFSSCCMHVLLLLGCSMSLVLAREVSDPKLLKKTAALEGLPLLTPDLFCLSEYQKYTCVLVAGAFLSSGCCH